MRNTFIALLLVSLTACGFQLRGQVNIPADLRQVYIDGPVSGLLYRELDSTLANADIKLVKSVNKAGLVLTVFKEFHQRNVLSVGDSAQVREYEVVYHLHAGFKKPDGKPVLEKQEIVLSRDYSFTEQLILAKEREEERLINDMRRQAVQILLRRLGHASRK